MLKNVCFLIIFSVIYSSLYAQHTQTIRGIVLDKDTRSPLIGVSILLSSVNPHIGMVSNEMGQFRFEEVPNGRHEISFSSIGYKTKTINDIILSSAHETILEIELEEMLYQTEEIVVKAGQRKDKPINPMAQVSARSFSVEETERYAGSWGDPARMASNYAGVMASSEARNDIIIRGNSPLGLLWRLEGNNIPNPNHFGAMGTTGGPISMINNNLLRNSDFYTSAFPAKYGNALSGVFDLYLRPGNNEKREYVCQIGLNGFELGAEGPFSKAHKSSYLINYRYSFLGLMEKLGIHYGPKGTVPEFQDISYKIDLSAGKAGNFSLFGIAGNSNVGSFDSKKDSTKDFTYKNFGQDFQFKAGMMTNGVNHVYTISQNTRLVSRLAFSGSFSDYRLDSVSKADFGKTLQNRSKFVEWQYSCGTEISTKLNSKDFLNAGIGIDVYQPFYRDSSLQENGLYKYGSKANGTMALFQPYIELNHKFNDFINLYFGLHSQYFGLNNSFSLEPRTGLKWSFSSRQSLSVGYGLHSQLQPHQVYFSKAYIESENTYFETSTKDLGFTKSHHFVLGYDYLIAPNLRLKVETYYQYIFDVPVEQKQSSISMLNYGADYYVPVFDSLVNKGTGRNYGIELTFEKFFSRHYYFLITTSLFDSKYKGSDNIERNTAFNNRYVINALTGYEFELGKNKTLTVSSKFVNAGGKRYTPYTIKEKSDHTYDIEYINERAYEEKYRPYLRLDIMVIFRLNHRKTTDEWMLDFENVTNNKNIFYKSIDIDTGKEVTTYLQGFAFMMMWRMRF